jgi:hypothetical protein
MSKKEDNRTKIKTDIQKETNGEKCRMDKNFQSIELDVVANK